MKVILPTVAVVAIGLIDPAQAFTLRNYVPTASAPSSRTEDAIATISTIPTKVVRIPLDSTSSSSTLATTVSARQTVPTCKWAALLDKNGMPAWDGKVGISCPVYDPFYKTYFYGKPVTVEQHQQNLLEYRQKQVDQYRTAQQQYAEYIQNRFRYQQELAEMSQQHYLQYFEQQQEFQKGQLAYQQELQARQKELQKQRMEEQQKMWEEYKETGFFPTLSTLNPTYSPFNTYWSPFGAVAMPTAASADTTTDSTA